MPKRVKTKQTKPVKENIWNVPNTLTAIRIILTFVTLYFIFARFDIIYVVVAFSVGMFTDFLDGQIARRFKLETEFGRKFDILADRFLMLSTVVGLLFASATMQYLSKFHVLQIFLILSREIISAPVFIIAYLAKKPLVHARYIGKVTTFLQGFAFPSILLSMDYKFFAYAPYLSLFTFVIGVFSAVQYIKDVKREDS